MQILSFIIFLLLFSVLFAKVEISIEGPYGWAEYLPTWKLSSKHWTSRLFLGGRPMTGYHVWMISFIVAFSHLVYLFQDFTLATELRLLSFLILFGMTEDFLWFALNPAFGIKKFKK